MVAQIQDGSSDGRMQSRDDLAQFSLSASCDPCHTKDLTAICIKGDIVQSFYSVAVQTCQIDHLKPFFSAFYLWSLDFQTDRAPYHHLCKLGLVRLRRIDYTDIFTFTQDCYPVRDGKHLIKFVSDDDNRFTVFFHIPEHSKQFVRLLRSQHRRRLIQDQDVRTFIKYFQDLYRLLFRNRHIVNFLCRVHFKPISFCKLRDFLVGLFPVYCSFSVKSEYDILRCRQHVYQFEMLMDHTYSKGKRIFRGTDRNLPAFHEDFPVVREVNTRQHIHQGSLSAAIFTQECKDLTGLQFEIDIFICDNLSKSFCHMMHLYSILCCLSQNLTFLLFLSLFCN